MRRAILFCFLMLFTLFAAYSQNWDIKTLQRINGWDSPFVKTYSNVFSESVPYISVGLPTAMLLYGVFDKNEKVIHDAVYIGSSVAEAVVLTYGLKYVFDRKRPYQRYPDLIRASNTEDTPSFPSGHAAAAFSLATSLSIQYPKWYVIAPSAVWAFSVGFARMNEGVHYPSDIMAGAAIGVGCAFANIYVNRWLNRWLFGKKKEDKTMVYNGYANP